MNTHSLIYTDSELKYLRQAGKIVSSVLWEMINKLKPGTSSYNLDQIAAKTLKLHGARSAPKMEGFPGHTCISVNDVIAHGVPSKRVLRCGDQINIDVSAEYKGFFADVAYTLILGNYSHDTNQLLECAKRATFSAIEKSVAGTPFSEVAKVIESEARDNGYTVIKNLCSHGVGKSLHAHPQNILNYYDHEETMLLEEGMVIAWEPYISSCAIRAIEQENEWNLTTHNKSEVAQFEHTILITDNKPEILTVLD